MNVRRDQVSSIASARGREIAEGRRRVSTYGRGLLCLGELHRRQTGILVGRQTRGVVGRAAERLPHLWAGDLVRGRVRKSTKCLWEADAVVHQKAIVTKQSLRESMEVAYCQYTSRIAKFGRTMLLHPGVGFRSPMARYSAPRMWKE